MCSRLENSPQVKLRQQNSKREIKKLLPYKFRGGLLKKSYKTNSNPFQTYYSASDGKSALCKFSFVDSLYWIVLVLSQWLGSQRNDSEKIKVFHVRTVESTIVTCSISCCSFENLSTFKPFTVFKMLKEENCNFWQQDFMNNNLNNFF